MRRPRKAVILVLFCAGSGFNAVGARQLVVGDPTASYRPFLDAAPVTQETLNNTAEQMQAGAADILSKARSIHTHKQVGPSPTAPCRENLSATCPMGWHLGSNSDGNTVCAAPPEYTGFCKRQLSFSDIDAAEKARLAVQCNFRWPCLEESETCEQDTSLPCPEDFILPSKNDTSCIPNPITYHGSCFVSVNFAGMTHNEKLKWAHKCGTRWTCLTAVHPETTRRRSACPQGWSEQPQYSTCLAPTHSACHGEWRFTYWTESMKDALSEACSVPWLSEGPPCEYNMEAPCPDRWQWDPRQHQCIADRSPIEPHPVLNNCAVQAATFVNVSLTDRRLFMSRCGVQWPCKTTHDTCQRDWTSVCPLNWDTVSQTSKECRPTLMLESNHLSTVDCTSPRVFQTWTEEDRRKWASSCLIPWPCVNKTEDQVYTENEIAKHPEAYLRSVMAHSPPILELPSIRKPGGPVNPVTGDVIYE